MELKRMEQLAALEHRIDTATEKLKVEIKCGLMDTAQVIEEIKLQIAQFQSQKGDKR